MQGWSDSRGFENEDMGCSVVEYKQGMIGNRTQGNMRDPQDCKNPPVCSKRNASIGLGQNWL